jgi:hypothetical protein
MDFSCLFEYIGSVFVHLEEYAKLKLSVPVIPSFSSMKPTTPSNTIKTVSILLFNFTPMYYFLIEVVLKQQIITTVDHEHARTY